MTKTRFAAIGRPRAAGAFTLVEVMVALLVLALAFGTAFPVLQRGFYEVDNARAIAAAGAILQAELEKERLFTWAQASDTTYRPTIDAAFTGDPALAGRFALTRTVVPMTGRETRMLQITLTATWRSLEGIVCTRRFTTYYRKNGLYDYLTRTS